MDIETVKLRLGAKGLDDKEIDLVISDVGEIIGRKIVLSCRNRMRPDLVAEFDRIAEDGQAEFMRKYRDQLPMPSEEDLKNILKETWEEYFRLMGIR